MREARICRGCGILSVGRTSMIDTGLQGKVVVVTGANHGIGAATAKAFADQGARVSTDGAPGFSGEVSYGASKYAGII